MRRSISNPDGKHRYVRYRSSEWKAARAAERYQKKLYYREWLRINDPITYELVMSMEKCTRQLAYDMYGDGTTTTDNSIRGLQSWVDSDE